MDHGLAPLAAPGAPSPGEDGIMTRDRGSLPMPERTVFRGRDGWWYAVEETDSLAGTRIDMTCLGSTDELAGVEPVSDGAGGSDPGALYNRNTDVPIRGFRPCSPWASDLIRGRLRTPQSNAVNFPDRCSSHKD